MKNRTDARDAPNPSGPPPGYRATPDWCIELLQSPWDDRKIQVGRPRYRGGRPKNPGGRRRPPPKANVCRVCDQSFTRPNALLTHLNSVHLRKKLFPYPECDKALATAASLTRHRRQQHNMAAKAAGRPKSRRAAISRRNWAAIHWADRAVHGGGRRYDMHLSTRPSNNPCNGSTPT